MKISWTTVIIFGVVAFILGRILYFKPAFEEKDQAPDFSASILSGEDFKLQQLRGHYVLLEFWGSWCGPCRQANPKLRAIYAKYRNTRFEKASSFQMVSVGIEKSRDSWLRAIRQDGLDWPYHILDPASSLRFFDAPLSKLYGIREVPSSYLIGPDGSILARNLDLDMLDAFLRKNAIMEQGSRPFQGSL